MPQGLRSQTDYGYGRRADGSLKGRGFFGPIPSVKGTVATELGANSTVDGRDLHYPLIHPNLNREQIDYLVKGGKPTPELHDLAIKHAMERLGQGLQPFAGEGDKPLPLPESAPKLKFAMSGAVPGTGTAPSEPITLHHGFRRMPKRNK